MSSLSAAEGVENADDSMGRNVKTQDCPSQKTEGRGVQPSCHEPHSAIWLYANVPYVPILKGKTCLCVCVVSSRPTKLPSVKNTYDEAAYTET